MIVSCPVPTYPNNNYSNNKNIVKIDTNYTNTFNRSLVYSLESTNTFNMTEPIFTVKNIIKTIDMKRLQLVLGIALMMFVSLIKAFTKDLPKDYLPWITTIIAICLSGLLGLYFSWPRDKIFIDALAISTCAGGLWSLIGKHIFNVDY